jgi:hypothetical protein
VKRFGFFSEYVNALTGEPKTDGVPGYALMNKALANYGSDFVDQIGIELFMQWYIKNENILGRTNNSIRNVVVVCHSDILKTFCKAHLNENDLRERDMGGDDAFFKHTHNYCIQVQVIMPVRQLTPLQSNPPLVTPAKSLDSLVVAKQDAKKMQLNAQASDASATISDALARRIDAGHIRAAGGKKHKKTKRMKRTKSNKSKKNQFKKTRVAKQRGGGEGTDYVDQTDYIYQDNPLPATYDMTITKAIDGTDDNVRYSKNKDCICEPDAYQTPDRTFLCAKTHGKDDYMGFASRQKIPEVETEVERAALDKKLAEARAAGILTARPGQ